MEIKSFKNAMALFPTGVAIATTGTEVNKIGLTINSLTSVSIDPPLILFCIEKSSQRLEKFIQNKNLVINILSDSQENICNIFFKLKDMDWNKVSYTIGKFSSCPIIDNTCAFLECEKWQIYEGGDHLIFVCKILNVETNFDLNPLVYAKRKFITIKDVL